MAQDYSVYTASADKIYAPQVEAEKAQAELRKKAALSGLAEEKKTVEPEYQKALRNLSDQMREGEGKLNQLYSLRLGGMFSGLQGNDLGMFYSKGNQQRSDIETARAGKLSSIASRETLAGERHAADVSSLMSKYRGMRNQYSQQMQQDALRAEEERRRYEQEMAFKREASGRARSSSGDSQIDPGKEFLDYITQQFAKSGGQGNKNISRQQQDKWADAWFAMKGVNNKNDRQFYWDLFNATYNRSANPHEDWRYRR